MKKELLAVAALLFANHPDENKYFITSDHNAFSDANEHRADAHSRTLPDTTIVKLSRSEVEQELAASKKETAVKPTIPIVPVTKEKTADEIAADAEKAKKAALKPRYLELYGKAPAHQYNSAKIKELIEAKEVEIKNAEDKISETSQP